MNRRVYIINRVFWPAEDATAQLAHDLALGLAQHDWQVTVITATPGPPSQLVPDDAGDRCIDILRTGHDGRRHTGYRAKAGAYLRFLRAARREVLAQVQPGDKVIVKTDPPLLGLWLDGPLSRCEAQVFHWVQDIFPEIAISLRAFGPLSPLLRLLKPLRDRVWQKSTGIVSLGEDMTALIRSRLASPPWVRVVPNWPPAGLTPLDPTATRQSWGIAPDEFVLGYSGNLGRAHDLSPLLQLAEKLKHVSKVRIVIVGHGPQLRSLRSAAIHRKLDNISFHPPAPRPQLGANLTAIDLHVVTMRESCLGMIWPSKFYGIVQCERPLLFFGPSSAEISQLIHHHQLGFASPSNEIDEAVKFVRTLLTEPAEQHRLSRNVKDFANREVGAHRSISTWNTLLSEHPTSSS